VGGTSGAIFDRAVPRPRKVADFSDQIVGVLNDRAGRFLIAPLDNFKKMFSSLLAGGARAFRTQGSGDEIVASADMASRQVSAFWKKLCRNRIA
jgi:hypothetical protein